jgi:hypothetical protein
MTLEIAWGVWASGNESQLTIGHCIWLMEVVVKRKEAVMAERKSKKCARPGCNCPAAKGSKYCSPHWEGVPINHLSIACERGHTECAAGKAAGAAG